MSRHHLKLFPLLFVTLLWFGCAPVEGVSASPPQPTNVTAMHRMLQQKKADDFVIGTGETHSVEEFVEEAFEYAGLDREKYVKIDPKYFRPTEVESLVADASKARKVLRFSPKVRFKELTRVMVDADMRAAGLEPPGEGDRILRRKFPRRWWTVD